MSDPFDVLEALGKSAQRYLAVGEDPAADELLVKITRTSTSAPTRATGARRRRRHLAIAVGTITLFGAGTAAAIGWWTAKPTTTTQITCYSDASRQPAMQVGLAAHFGSSPTEQCQSAWTNGPISTLGPPPLVECITENGLIAVVPGAEGTCASLGLAANAVTAPGEGEGPSAALRLQDALSDQFSGVCATVDEARATIQKILDREDLTNWTVAVGTPLDDSRRCAAPAVDEQARVVLIIGVPGE